MPSDILAFVLEHPAAWVALWYFVASLVAFVLYGWDKRCAARGRWRVSEATLHLWELLGGWPGAVCAQRVFRHKTIKTSFRVVFYLMVALNVFALAFAIHRGWLG